MKIRNRVWEDWAFMAFTVMMAIFLTGVYVYYELNTTSGLGWLTFVHVIVAVSFILYLGLMCLFDEDLL